MRWPAETIIQLTVAYDVYKDHLVDQAALMLTLSGRVNETQQVLATQFSFRLRTPDIIIKVGNNTNLQHITVLCSVSSLTLVFHLFSVAIADQESCGWTEDGSGNFIHKPAARCAEICGVQRGRHWPPISTQKDLWVSLKKTFWQQNFTHFIYENNFSSLL